MPRSKGKMQPLGLGRDKDLAGPPKYSKDWPLSNNKGSEGYCFGVLGLPGMQLGGRYQDPE